MKQTGIVRYLDNQGRFVIPSEIRKCLDIKAGDGLSINMQGNKIVIEKYEPVEIDIKQMNVSFVDEIDIKEMNQWYKRYLQDELDHTKYCLNQIKTIDKQIII